MQRMQNDEKCHTKLQHQKRIAGLIWAHLGWAGWASGCLQHRHGTRGQGSHAGGEEPLSTTTKSRKERGGGGAKAKREQSGELRAYHKRSVAEVRCGEQKALQEVYEALLNLENLRHLQVLGALAAEVPRLGPEASEEEKESWCDKREERSKKREERRRS